MIIPDISPINGTVFADPALEYMDDGVYRIYLVPAEDEYEQIASYIEEVERLKADEDYDLSSIELSILVWLSQIDSPGVYNILRPLEFQVYIPDHSLTLDFKPGEIFGSYITEILDEFCENLETQIIEELPQTEEELRALI